jgi:hypothetical protein
MTASEWIADAPSSSLALRLIVSIAKLEFFFQLALVGGLAKAGLSECLSRMTGNCHVRF